MELRRGSRLFPPLIMVWCMIRQALYPDPSCRAILAWLQTGRASEGLPLLSQDTSGYCKARQRLPAELLPRLAKRTAKSLTHQAVPERLWFGRRVLAADGSAFSMPDTLRNSPALPTEKRLRFSGGCLCGSGLSRYRSRGRRLYWRRQNARPGHVLLRAFLLCRGRHLFGGSRFFGSSVFFGDGRIRKASLSPSHQSQLRLMQRLYPEFKIFFIP